MKPTVPLFLLPISTLALSLPPLIERQSRDSTPCAPLHIIALRGLNANNADPDWYQFLHQSVFQILASVPGSTSLGLQYDAGNTNQIEAINNGTVMLQEYVQSYVARCPEGKLGLLGYSDVSWPLQRESPEYLRERDGGHLCNGYNLQSLTWHVRAQRRPATPSAARAACRTSLYHHWTRASTRTVG